MGAKLLRDIAAGDANDFARYLRIDRGNNENTQRKHISIAKQIFNDAVRGKLFDRSPFEGMASGGKANPQRFFFVTQESIEAIIAQCT